MTFCVGIKIRDGVVALADTRITRGAEQSSKRKLSLQRHADRSLFTMTSGLRSVRDKSMVYLDDALRRRDRPLENLYELVNLFGEQLRRVKREDGPSLAASNLSFNLNAIIGGALPGDRQPELFCVYPEGNWIQASADAPYFMIGRTHYGRPILDRCLTDETTIPQAIALALLAFEATSGSVNDVDYPIDIAVLPGDGSSAISRRFEASQLAAARSWWKQTLRKSLDHMPMDWASDLLGREGTVPK